MEPENGFGLIRRDPPPRGGTALTAYLAHAEIRLVLRCAWTEDSPPTPGGSVPGSDSRSLEVGGPEAVAPDPASESGSGAVTGGGPSGADPRGALPGVGAPGEGASRPSVTADHRYWADRGL